MSTFAIGDIHGRFDAFREVVEKSPFDIKKDRLIILGDIVDGGIQTKECIEYALNIPDTIFIIGNHDVWALDWFERGKELSLWVHQGGLNTMASYQHSRENIPQSHINFLKRGKPYWIDDKNNIFVHGGFNPKIPICKNHFKDLIWDRDLIKYAQEQTIKNFNHVYIGHTTTQLIDLNMNATKPFTFNNLTMLDTGAGWNGKLTIMNVETREYWQSEIQKPNRV